MSPGSTTQSFEHLYESQWHTMVRVAIFLLDDVESAKDCVQDAFLALYSSPPSNLDAQIAYLHRAVVNRARSMLRRRRTARAHLRHAALPEVEGADRGLFVRAEHEQLMTAFQRLPRRQREVLVLRYWSNLSEAEIATALGVRPGTVKSAASRALNSLETKLGGRR
jgi:RNA polymerase sigma-70 factor (sigma-E family)